MSGRRAIVGVAVLCAMAFTAIAASGAQAAGHGWTAYTCVPGGGSANTNADCETGSSGTSGHVAIAAGTTTELSVTATTNQVFKSEVAELLVELEGTGVNVKAAATHSVTNIDHGAEPMDVSGEVTLEYTGVAVKAAPVFKNNCKVVGEKVTTEALTSTTTANGWTKFSPKVGTVFAKISFEKLPGKTCVLEALSPFSVEGTIELNHNGAKLIAEPANNQALTLGGEPATLAGTVTVSGKDPSISGDTFKPLSMTES